MSTVESIRTRHDRLKNGGMGNCDVAHLRVACNIPDSIAISNCTLRDHDTPREYNSEEIPIFASYFSVGLTLPLHPFTRSVLQIARICPCQGNGNFYRIVSGFILLGKLIKDTMHPHDLFHLYSMKHEPSYGGFYFQRKSSSAMMFPKMPSNDSAWDKYPLLAVGNWEYGSYEGVSSAPRIARNKASAGALRDCLICHFNAFALCYFCFSN